MFDRNRIRQNFGRASGAYADRALVQAEVGRRLLERLEGLRFEPKTIVDLGSGPGIQARELARHFPGAQLVAMDIALPMLHQAQTQRGLFKKRFERVAADAHALPLAQSSVDLLFSNLMLQWCEDLPGVLNGFRRVLRPGGLLLISTFGPDTLSELKQASMQVDGQPRVSPFTDVQTVGDSLVRAGFVEPVLDTDWITSSYASPRDLFGELKAIGASHAGDGRRRGLTASATLKAIFEAYEGFREAGGRYPATWEVVYASAWAPEEGAPIRSIHGGEQASVSVANIGKRKRD
ncbi:MAG: malonyl-ACP O-methyltransferase BioC [Wenzhouxiangellaceae bacterium]|nr:malonyl-ACP O-methyltransferase BioC [Wenzhouxiangellaceae bacterium]